LSSFHDRLHRSQEQIREAQEALAYFQPNHWVNETFQGLQLIGRGEQYQNNFDAALASFQRLLDESSKAQDRNFIGAAQEGLGGVLSAQEMYPQALVHYQEFMKANTNDVGYAVLDCAITLVRLGRSPEALPLFKQAEEMAVKRPALLPTLARYRTEVALSRNEYADVIARTGTAGKIANLNPSTKGDLSRLLGRALLRSGSRTAGLQECQSAFAAAQELDDPGELLDARLALLEALLATRDSVRAASVFHDMEPSLGAHPESRWRALALLAHSERQYADHAKEALGQLDTLWGHEALLVYLKRADVQQFWPLLPANSAIH
jgi:tetratricopeptide (TPR) repeat protein